MSNQTGTAPTVGSGAWLGDEGRPIGHFTIELTVWCGLCEEWTQQPERSRKQMAHVIRRGGWRKTKDRGWLCPECAVRNRGRKKAKSPNGPDQGRRASDSKQP